MRPRRSRLERYFLGRVTPQHPRFRAVVRPPAWRSNFLGLLLAATIDPPRNQLPRPMFEEEAMCV
jgi:hypothetical protein